MYSQELAKYCKDNLDLANIKLNDEHYYSSLPFCIIDAVFSIGIKYTTTKKVVERFGKHINIEIFRELESDFLDTKKQYSINQFIEFYKNNEINFITEKVYNNRCRTSSNNGILKSQAVLEFAEVLQKYNINYFQDIEKVINNASFEKEIKWIKGQGSGISLQYFFMLSGNENLIKPDRMIERFVQSAIGKRLSTNEIIKLFDEVFNILKQDFHNLTLKKLDYEIWKNETNT